MPIKFSNCHTFFEQAIFLIAVLGILLTIFSAFAVFSNERKQEKFDWYIEILGPFHILLSSKGLNSAGAKWRPVLLLAIIATTSSFIALSYGGLCHARA